jgi:hypothetical protein
MAKRMELLPFKRAVLDATTETIDGMVVYNADAQKQVSKPRYYVFDADDFKAFDLHNLPTANVVVQVVKVGLSKDHMLGGEPPANPTSSWNKVKVHKLQ